MSNGIAQDALRIKTLLGIVNDRYNPNGVGENDLLIIATARAHGVRLVSNENKQPTLPQNFERWKIPAVCNMVEVRVDCINFVDYIKQSNAIFR